MRLRAKVLSLVNLLIALVIAAVGASLWTSERRVLLREAERRQYAALEAAAGILREAHITSDPLLLVNYLKLIEQTHPEVKWLCIVDKDGKIQASQDTNLIGDDRSLVAVPDELRLLTRPVASGGRSLGHIEIGFHKGMTAGAVESALSDLTERLSVIGLGAMALGFVCSFLLAEHISSPIRHLSQAAAEIGQGRLETSLDISRGDELGDLADSFKVMSLKLKELDHMKQDFVTTTTHELRSPLGAIESHANAVLEDLAGSDGIPPETLRKDWASSLQHIKVNTARLRRFINALLDLARIERGKLDFNPTRVSLGEIIEELTAFFGPQAQERGIGLSHRVSPALPAVFADPERVHQVLVNLLGNALRFTPAGGAVRIIAVVDSPKFVRVQVADTGPGIPKEFMGRLFTKFERHRRPGAMPRDPGGTGLGLAICKGIVERHGGLIGIESSSGRGSVFYFTLPVAES